MIITFNVEDSTDKINEIISKTLQKVLSKVNMTSALHFRNFLWQWFYFTKLRPNNLFRIYNLSLQEHVSYDEKDETCDGIRFVALAVDTSTKGNKAKLTDMEKSIDFNFDDSNMDFNL